MKRSSAVLAGAGLALSTILSLSGVAIAQDQEPDPEITCAEAVIMRTEAQSAFDQARVPSQEQTDVTEAKTEVEAKVAAQADLAVPGDLGATLEEIARLEAAQADGQVVDNIENRIAAIRAVLSARAELEKQEGELEAAQKAEADARAKLDEAIAVFDRECDGDDAPPVTDDNDNGSDDSSDTDEDDVVPDTSNGVATGLA